MKQRLCALLALCLLLCAAAVPARAADKSRAYSFELSANGEHEINAKPGDIVTVTLRLHRTDSEEPAPVYGMQDEIRYDTSFFEILEGSILSPDKIVTKDIALVDGDHAFYVNFLSLNGGERWNANTLLCSFQVRVLAQSGSSILKSENLYVPTADGMDSFAVASEDLRVIVSKGCTVRMNPMNGGAVMEQTVTMGELLGEPEIPVREGYVFTGWYTDTNFRSKWSFDTDRVENNMTLYAGWEPDTDAQGTGTSGENTRSGGAGWLLPVGLGVAALLLALLLLALRNRRTVEYVTAEGEVLRKVQVKKGSRLEPPPIPKREGQDFIGWYRDKAMLRRWNFESDTVEDNIKIYAKWR